MPFYIKNIEIENQVILAPMAGITSFSYRKLMKKMGASLTYTEMISDCGINYDNKKTFDLLQSNGEDRPLALQLFGGKTTSLVEAVKNIEKSGFKYDILDLNLACPVPKVTKNNGGSSRLLDQDALFSMVKEVIKASSKPVSAKIRLGFNNINVEETVKTLSNAGINFLAIHARTKKDGYTGKANYEALKNIKKITNVPFCVSGDIYTPEDAVEAIKITSCDAIMVARGGIGNPQLITNIDLALKGESKRLLLNPLKQLQYLKEYSFDLKNELGEKRACSILKGIAPKFFLKFPNLKELRCGIINNLDSIEDMMNFIDSFLKEHLIY